ncbi:MAG: MogA/MoaB family molybdenum cofactor biosynthesis protein [Armatimonadota bacterium]|nr:MogA/MoaB family molybdenum cofactor biosynthesis protein [Armatimonadota bacterium]
MRVAILTASDRCSAGEAVDESGPAVENFCVAQGWEVIYRAIVPDELERLAGALEHCVYGMRADLVLTTGGTGLGPRDVTPEATIRVCDRLAPGIAETLRAESLKKTPFAMLSRGVAGTMGRTLLINLPGSPRAVVECLEILQPILGHAVAVAGGASH